MAWVIEISYRDRNETTSFRVKRPVLWDVMPADRRDAWVQGELGQRTVRAQLLGWREVKK